MVTPLRTFQQIYQDKNLTNEEKIELLNKHIHEATTPDDKCTFYSIRAFLFYDTRNWQNVLSDLQQVEIHGALNSSLSVLKQKAYIQYHFKVARDAIIVSMDTYLFDPFLEHQNLLDSINQEKISKMLGDVKKKGKRT